MVLLGSQILPMYQAFAFIFALQVLNIFLAAVMILRLDGNKWRIQKVIDLFSVLVTDKEYDAPDFENEHCRFEEMSDLTSITISEITYFARAVIDLDNEGLLTIGNDRDVGLHTKKIWPNWNGTPSPLISGAKLVRIEKNISILS